MAANGKYTGIGAELAVAVGLAFAPQTAAQVSTTPTTAIGWDTPDVNNSTQTSPPTITGQPKAAQNLPPISVNFTDEDGRHIRRVNASEQSDYNVDDKGHFEGSTKLNGETYEVTGKVKYEKGKAIVTIDTLDYKDAEDVRQKLESKTQVASKNNKALLEKAHTVVEAALNEKESAFAVIPDSTNPNIIRAKNIDHIYKLTITERTSNGFTFKVNGQDAQSNTLTGTGEFNNGQLVPGSLDLHLDHAKGGTEDLKGGGFTSFNKADGTKTSPKGAPKGSELGKIIDNLTDVAIRTNKILPSPANAVPDSTDNKASAPHQAPSGWMPNDATIRNPVTGNIATSRIDENGVRETTILTTYPVAPNSFAFADYVYPEKGVTVKTTGFVDYGTEKNPLSKPAIKLTGYSKINSDGAGEKLDNAQINNQANQGLAASLTSRLEKTLTGKGPNDNITNNANDKIITITDPSGPNHFYGDTPGGSVHFVSTTSLDGKERTFLFDDMIKGADGSVKHIEGHRSFTPDGIAFYMKVTSAPPVDKKAKNQAPPPEAYEKFSIDITGPGKSISLYTKKSPTGDAADKTFPPGGEMAQLYSAIEGITNKAEIFSPPLQNAASTTNTSRNTNNLPADNPFKLTELTSNSTTFEDDVWTGRTTPNHLTLKNKKTGVEITFDAFDGKITGVSKTTPNGRESFSYGTKPPIIYTTDKNGVRSQIVHTKNGWVKHEQVREIYEQGKPTGKFTGNNDLAVDTKEFPIQVQELFNNGEVLTVEHQVIAAGNALPNGKPDPQLVKALDTIGITPNNAGNAPQQPQAGQPQADGNKQQVAVGKSSFVIVGTPSAEETVLTRKDNNQEEWKATISNKAGEFKLVNKTLGDEIDITVDANGKPISAKMIQGDAVTSWQASGAKDPASNMAAKNAITATFSKGGRALGHIAEDSLKGAELQGSPASSNLLKGLGEFGIEVPAGHAVLEPNRLGGTTPTIVAQAQRKAGLTTLGIG